MNAPDPDSRSTAPPASWLAVDLLVVGSGAAGLAAAVAAAEAGLKVAVLEKHDRVGGTSAWCGGWMWLPEGDDPHREAMAGATAEEPRAPGPMDCGAVDYLRRELGDEVFRRQRPKIEAYLQEGPRMLTFLRKLALAPLKFERDTETPDFHETLPGRAGGRMVRVPAFDARRLGPALTLLRLPLRELTLAGMAIEDGRELDHFLHVTRSFGSFVYVARRLLGFAWDLLTHGRSMRLVNGNALIAGLLLAALEIERAQTRPGASGPGADEGRTPNAQARAGFPAFERLGIFPGHPVRRLLVEGSRVCGALVDTPQGTREVRAGKGVVLACGGFPHDLQRLREWLAHAPTGLEHHSAAPAANTGDGLRLGEGVGGRVSATAAAPAAWAPVSLLRRRDGGVATYPHFVDRAKPGVIAVDRGGMRFVDEAKSYHDVVAQWLAESKSDGPLHAWLVCDRRFLWRYGLGAVKPVSPWPWWALHTGYLKVGRTIEALAHACGIESRGLRSTVDAYNRDAPVSDPAFRRGETPYDRSQGDHQQHPNPCVAPIVHAPFYAVRLQPGSLGTLAGLQTDEQARVLRDGSGAPIPGLWACGNDMAAVMGGFYPSNGVTLGSAMTFGFLAGRAAAATPDPSPR